MQGKVFYNFFNIKFSNLNTLSYRFVCTYDYTHSIHLPFKPTISNKKNIFKKITFFIFTLF